VKARIKEKRDVAKGTLMVVFDLLGEEVDFQPGQYFWVTLIDPPYDDEKGPRRHITVVTSPTERGVLGLATRLRDSALKRSLAERPTSRPASRATTASRPRRGIARGLQLSEVTWLARQAR
jgi:hypothetical protein